MSKVIIYKNSDGNISVVYPANSGITIEEIEIKDVPKETPYQIIEESELPSKITFMEACEQTTRRNPLALAMGSRSAIDL